MPSTSPITHDSRLPLTAPAASVVPYLRRVYGLLTGGVGFAIAGALVALYAGSPVGSGGSGAPPVPRRDEPACVIG